MAILKLYEIQWEIAKEKQSSQIVDCYKSEKVQLELQLLQEALKKEKIHFV